MRYLDDKGVVTLLADLTTVHTDDVAKDTQHDSQTCFPGDIFSLSTSRLQY
jgi:hypothetical protein